MPPLTGLLGNVGDALRKLPVVESWLNDRVASMNSWRCMAATYFPASPADANATIGTKAVYHALQRFGSCRNPRFVVGQALRGFDYENAIDEPITSLPGPHTPAFLEVDLKDFEGYFYLGDNDGVKGQPRPVANPSSVHDGSIFTVLRQHAAKGGLVGFCFHAGNPFSGGDVKDRAGEKPNVALNLAELANPAAATTPPSITWRRSLDHVAQIIKRFNAESVNANPVVLFRPFHECNGHWFWWGQREQSAFTAAWQGLFNYLTGFHGLHNLLWVYSSSNTVTQPNATFYLPNIKQVDILGVDIYHDDLWDGGAYQLFLTKGKPFAITEYGPTEGQVPPHTGADLPNTEVLTTIKSKYPRTVLATCWYTLNNNNYQISDKPQPAVLLGDPSAVTLPLPRPWTAM